LKTVFRVTTLKRVFRELRLQTLPPQVTKTVFEGHEVVDVQLTDEIVKKAIALGVKVQETSVAKGFTPIIRANEYQNIFGLKCQFAFFLYAFGNWVEALDYVSVVTGKETDVMDAQFRGYSIDVKGRTKRWHDILMVPEIQFRRKRYDFYIGCNQWQQDVIRFWGYTARAELEAVEPQDFGYGATRAKPYMELHLIKDMLKLKPKSAREETKAQNGNDERSAIRSAEETRP
jgi:hypothetical protein